MFLTHKFPKLHFQFSVSTLHSIKSNKLFSVASTPLSKPSAETNYVPTPTPTPLAHFSALSPIIPLLSQEQGSLQLSLETLFVPPETDVSSLKNELLSERILKGSNIVLSKYAGQGVDVVNAEFVKSSVKREIRIGYCSGELGWLMRQLIIGRKKFVH